MSKGSRIRKNKYRGINTSIIAETIKEIKPKKKRKRENEQRKTKKQARAEIIKEVIDKISKDVNVMVACKEDIKPAQIIELTIKEIRGLLK